METLNFYIKYDGAALQSHTMDVRELSPALLALADAIEAANRELNGDKVKVQVNVRGNFQTGSFRVDLSAVQSIFDQVTSVLAGQSWTATANLLAVLTALGFVGSGGLIALIKRIRGRPIKKIVEDNGRCIVEIQSDELTVERVEVDIATGRLVASRAVRTHLSAVIRPLAKDGIELFVSGRDGEPAVTIDKRDADFFDAELVGDERVVGDRTDKSIIVQIESAVFKDGNKWRLTDGGNSFYAEISDPDFIARVQSGQERFGKADILVVDLQRQQLIVGDKLRTDYTVVKVHEHRAPLQGNFELGS